MKRAGLFSALVMALSLGSAGASVAQEDAAIKPVKLLQVTEAPVAFERQFFGRVKARQSVDLAFQVGGQIVDFPVTEGFNIKKGEMIARLDLEIFELNLDRDTQLSQAAVVVHHLDANVKRTFSEHMSNGGLISTDRIGAIAEVPTNGQRIRGNIGRLDLKGNGTAGVELFVERFQTDFRISVFDYQVRSLRVFIAVLISHP